MFSLYPLPRDIDRLTEFIDIKMIVSRTKQMFSSFQSASVKFAGYQVGYSIWGKLMFKYNKSVVLFH